MKFWYIMSTPVLSRRWLQGPQPRVVGGNRWWWVRPALYHAGVRLLISPLLVLAIMGFVVYSTTHPPRSQINVEPGQVNLYHEAVHFSSDDGICLKGWYIPALTAEDVVTQGTEAVTTKRPAVVLAHGYGGNCSQWLPFASVLHRAGYELLLFDFRGSGTSSGRNSTFGLRESQDVIAAVRFISGLPSVDSKRIAVMGTSTGGVAATQAALSTPLIKLVIAESAYPDLASVITRQFSMGHWPFSWLAVAYKWTFEMGYRADADAVRMDDTLRSRKDLALLLVNGDQDQLAPWDDLAELVRVAPERTKRVIIPGAGHSACYAAAPELFETVILSFLAQHLSDGRGSGDQTDFATRTDHSTASY